MDEQRVLNLDEVFGQDRPVKVLWQGREYELLRLDAFSPRQIHALGSLQEAAARLGSKEPKATDAPDADADAEIEALFDGMLKVLCAELPLDRMPFLAKTRIITFYIEEMQGKKVLEEVLMKAPIGATS